ncbi:MAG: MFS transporter [Gammaproteobacteria bacterium]|nr:MFS transporter [Gammaproteobacteria bacterium]MBU2065524.1 MFS transporter [Gammaproteobacteria bacterium]MBU2140442.1 MFS transporter [Gammaproteobacteria bacterium]MBU2256019.1 MFS transporter [Gammaproteobacteria bacterium]
MLLVRNPSIRLLFAGQALYWSCSMIGITLTALVGLQLAPLNILATLPLCLWMLGNLFSVQPLSRFMQRHGRRPGLMLGAGAGVIGGLLSALGVWLGDFTLFCLGALPIGAYQASAMYYRFAALEAVAATEKGRASGYVIGGGVLAALLVPSALQWTGSLLNTPFVSAYLLIATFALLALLLMSRLREGAAPPKAKAGFKELRQLLGNPIIRAAIATTAIGNGLMVLVMNATPLAMSFCGFALDSSAQVIQWHMLGMFLPAFLAGPLVDRLGSRRVALLGGLILLGSASIALSGVLLLNFLFSSLLLGLGWNLMLVAGTTLLAEGHDESQRGQAQGLMELLNGILAAGAAFSAGVLISGLGWSALNLVILPLVGLALLMLLPARRNLQPSAS